MRRSKVRLASAALLLLFPPAAAAAGMGVAHAASQCKTTTMTISGIDVQWNICITDSPAPVASMEPPTCVRRTPIGNERRQCVIEGTYVLRKGTETLKSGPFQAVNQQDDGTTVRPWPVSFTCQGRADYTFKPRVQKFTYSASPVSIDVTSQVTATLC